MTDSEELTKASLTGSGAIAHGNGAQAVGAGAILINGAATNSSISIDNHTINSCPSFHPSTQVPYSPHIRIDISSRNPHGSLANQISRTPSPCTTYMPGSPDPQASTAIQPAATSASPSPVSGCCALPSFLQSPQALFSFALSLSARY